MSKSNYWRNLKQDFGLVWEHRLFRDVPLLFGRYTALPIWCLITGHEIYEPDPEFGFVLGCCLYCVKCGTTWHYENENGEVTCSPPQGA